MVKTVFRHCKETTDDIPVGTSGAAAVLVDNTLYIIGTYIKQMISCGAATVLVDNTHRYVY